MIDILGWAATRAAFVQAVTTTAFPDSPLVPANLRGQTLASVVTDDDGNELLEPDGTKQIRPLRYINISEIGAIVKTPSVIDPDTLQEITPAVIIAGHHVNFRVSGPIADLLLINPADPPNLLPQTDADGNPLSVWERTNLLQLVPELDATALTEIGEGGALGYVGLSGLKLFDPGVVTTPANVWA